MWPSSSSSSIMSIKHLQCVQPCVQCFICITVQLTPRKRYHFYCQFCNFTITNLESWWGRYFALGHSGRLVVKARSSQGPSNYRTQALMTTLSYSIMPGSETSGLPRESQEADWPWVHRVGLAFPPSHMTPLCHHHTSPMHSEGWLMTSNVALQLPI